MQLVIFLYHMFIINQQVANWKSLMLYDYPPHMVNSSGLSDQSQTLAYFKNYLKRHSLYFIAIQFSLKQFHKATKFICTLEGKEIAYFVEA